jgi:dynein heavy chain
VAAAADEALQLVEQAADQPAASIAEPAVAAPTQLHVCETGSLPAELHGSPAVYLSRSSGGPDNNSPLQLHEAEAAVACTLLPAGPSLTSLRLLLEHVMVPWLSDQQADSGQPQSGSSSRAAGQVSTDNGGAAPMDAASAASAELLAAAHKLAGQAAQAARHLRSEVQVQLPRGVDLVDMAAAAGNEEALQACERCMEEWVQLATAALQREAGLQPVGRGPLAELVFWQERAEAYGGLLEQLSVPAVHATQAVVERGSGDRNLPASFAAQLSELGRVALEARDNLKFLQTLERHFRALEGGSLQAVADALQPMLSALRMVGWT